MAVPVIYKYELIQLNRSWTMSLYEGYKVLSVGLDPKGNPCIWIQVYTDIPENAWRRKKVIEIIAIGTGRESSDQDRVFVGTFVEDALVWHVFYKEVGDL